jgi:hypothetical protein
MSTLRYCPQCGSMVRGRADKKFCDDLCRTRHNNSVNRLMTAEVRKVNSILMRNRRILNAFAEAQRIGTITKEHLTKHGFDFSYHTHTYAENGMLFKLCYDFGYAPLEKDRVVIVRQEAGNQ